GSGSADFDLDGDLDVYVASGYTSNPQENQFYINNGDGTFEKVLTGDLVTDAFRSHNPTWGDYDNDGYPDLFITSSEENNTLYHNEGDGTFTTITTVDIVNDDAVCHGSTWIDYNDDGHLDLMVNGIDIPILLYSNNGDGTFTTITTGELVTDANIGTLSPTWGDFDNDGDQDVYLVDSKMTIPSESYNKLYWNNGDGTFTKEVSTDDVINDWDASTAVASVDYNNDGFLDFILSVRGNVSNNNVIYTNNTNSNHWININLIGTESNKSAIGARVKLRATIDGVERWQHRLVSGRNGTNTQNSLNIEFGLGDAAIIDELVIDWPLGKTCSYKDLSVDQFITYEEECEEINSINENISFTEINAFPNPSNGSTTLSSNQLITGFKIFSIAGDIILQEDNVNGFSTSVNLSTHGNGIYLAKVITAQGTSQRTIVINK
ncbi:MAG: VCBS repeat-containing protein, partial [Flavobacteriales bacterium]|nr:VCBS repeat-containing protein [Flavobacteriales bacterium]